MRFDDLTGYEYLDGFEHRLNIGWLGANEPVSKGPVPSGFTERLLSLAVTPANVTRGFHDCEFCDRESPIRVRTTLDPRGFVSLGTGEIVVHGADGLTYVAPTLVYHYVVDHGYQPPRAFVDAVLSDDDN